MGIAELHRGKGVLIVAFKGDAEQELAKLASDVTEFLAPYGLAGNDVLIQAHVKNSELIQAWVWVRTLDDVCVSGLKRYLLDLGHPCYVSDHSSGLREYVIYSVS